MILISHRGNLSGPDPTIENNPFQITEVLEKGFDCEIDLWYIDGSFALGHDKPQYYVSPSFIKQKGLWIHCKNLEALQRCPRQSNFFWHQNDDFALTSHGYIWTFPDKPIGKTSVIVDNTQEWKHKNHNCYGVCSDYLI